MKGCGYRKHRSCANCGHEKIYHDKHGCHRGCQSLYCWCDKYLERKSRAFPTERQIDQFEYKHNLEMQRGLMDHFGRYLLGAGTAKCEPYCVITLGKEINVRDIKAAAKAAKALKRLAKRKAKRESEKRKRSTYDNRLTNPSAHRSQLRK